ncbi:putative amino acid uptake ABC transporter permease protein [Oceanicola granulosus HTCC2516]|uniref:Putative amino acid uptake ABC transporter permease protein n=1 Tax=Oceanicola granulosus (strain ATCC BAA-861 / DSM 15982 / KCTC 12143 / HTCC2516) TaxID=314256 RepID=Q2CGC6_OCEGH|nr:amino acid ABC transporter permease [Oceanicola granulosus]EAR51792.1 putative amino acid uptake ABC transporter permease protein [Oceanicola granulosus HTCC2516]
MLRLHATLSGLRPSNLMILAALPFIVWLFAVSTDYSRALRAILGIEPGASALLPGAALAAALFGGGVAGALLAKFDKPRRARVSYGISVLAGAVLALTDLGQPFAASVVANWVDPFASPLVVPGETPRRLVPEAAGAVARTAALLAGALALATAAGAMLPGKRARRAMLVLHGLGLGWLLLLAHLGFAVGLAVTIRAAIVAYLLAALLGLVWVGLMQLSPSRWTFRLFAAAALACLAAAGWHYAQPKRGYSLVGDIDGAVAIVSGTPRGLVDTVRFGAFPEAGGAAITVRSFFDAAAATEALAEGTLSGALLPEGAASAAPVFWQTAVLPPDVAGRGLALLVLGVLIGLMTLCGLLYRRHPLSVASEFLIDTLRGIPMLVIILYIGLPLAGVVKSSTGGFIDPPNMLRGIIAMAIAYSAYLAEIFRAGINAVPTGQIEAARSLGLSRWSTARHVILPQAFRIVIPPMGNEFIAILKDTSLLSILSIRDLTQRMREFQSASFLPFAPYNTAAIVYVLLTLVAASLIARVEHRFRQHRH